MDLTLLRKSYRLKLLDKRHLKEDPFEMFRQWMEEAIDSKIIEPNALSLATASKEGVPSCRTVLLKKTTQDGFFFFTNYESRKSHEIEDNPNAAMLFLWKELERQVTIEGKVEKISEEESLDYFKKRPRGSQISAWASHQGNPCACRKELESSFLDYEKKFEGATVPLPPNWGGFLLKPVAFEFWQGREDRLHDRFSYKKNGSLWDINRLSP